MTRPRHRARPARTWLTPAAWFAAFVAVAAAVMGVVAVGQGVAPRALPTLTADPTRPVVRSYAPAVVPSIGAVPETTAESDLRTEAPVRSNPPRPRTTTTEPSPTVDPRAQKVDSRPQRVPTSDDHPQAGVTTTAERGSVSSQTESPTTEPEPTTEPTLTTPPEPTPTPTPTEQPCEPWPLCLLPTSTTTTTTAAPETTEPTTTAPTTEETP